MTAKADEKQRKRAPSKRSLQTKARILDAAEQVFAARGFEGASIRDIAALAEVPLGLVSHHGGSKEELFHQAVARRAKELSRLRIEKLEARKALGPVSMRDVLDCFVRPYVSLAQTPGTGWMAYGRLVAHVSADPRWRTITAECFDPIAQRFIDEVAALFPGVDKALVAAGHVYTVAATLAYLNSVWRIEDLAAGAPEANAAGIDRLVDFCVAGTEAMIARGSA
ncbi:TetR family transcriptional regulator [Ruegeria marisrubri]|uniref:TetR family transcriptional regulator n=1 Tax=Ruegeria marisrubri TaxID=1685379 RepID=A0A0X3TKF5_9RHOB|nr:TetR/AcrR family transcriptional regulator [Ruegeria marisrubri]KUJ76245.1 TetR family transcriptional regulator [Ruegeria marisrubri]